MSHEHTHGSGDCRAMFERLSEYLDDELPPDLCKQFEGHLGDCDPCEKFLESLRRTVKLTTSTPSPRLSDDVRRDVKAAYQKLRNERGTR